MHRFICFFLGLVIIGCAGCTSPILGGNGAQPGGEEIVFYDWGDDIPVDVLAAFKKEFGITVRYETYNAQEEVIEKMRAGQVVDVAVLDSQYIPALIRAGMLAKIDYRNVPNFKNVSASFRDLIYDPGNNYSIPYSWGTTGLVVREDLVQGSVTSWNDLWRQDQAGKVMIWSGVQRQMMGIALKSLGYSANSDNPIELEAATARLIALRPNAIFGEDNPETQETSAPSLLSGEVVMAVGWATDVIKAREKNPAIRYVLPKEGALLWGDNFVISTNSSHKKAAELFLNFVLRPEISAQITNYNGYPTANENARPLIDPSIRNDPVVYPTQEDIKKAEIILPIGPVAEKLYNQLWEKFLKSE